MNERQRYLVIILVIITACLMTAGISITILYDAEFKETQERLRVTVQSQARLIESIARHTFDAADAMGLDNADFDPLAETMDNIQEAHAAYEGFGETGVFTLARREADSIVFLLRHNIEGVEQPDPVAFDSEQAEPMRRALNGQSGTMSGLDYRGETVLAAYEPVAVLNFGLVAKIDLAEIRSAFVTTGVIVLFAAILVGLIGALLFWRLSAPIILKIREHSDELAIEVEEHVKAQKELRKWELVFQHAGWGVVIAEPESRKLLAVNPAFARMHGYTVEEAESISLTDVISDENKAKLAERTRLVRATGREVFESIHVRKDGSNFPCLADVMVIRDEAGEILYHAANYRDITEQKESEDALRESESRLRTAQEIAQLGFLDWNLSTNKIRLSEQTRNIFGFNEPSERMDFDELRAAIHPEDAEEVISRLDRAVAGKQDYVIEHRIVRSDGEVRWVNSQAVLERDDQGQAVSLLGTMLDVTESKNVEEQRIQLVHQMLEEQKLVSLGTLAGGIAHQFNNLLMTIRGGADLALLQLTEDSPARVNIETVEKAALKASELSTQMLAFSGKGQFILEEINLNDCLREMKRLFDVSIPASVTLSFEFESSLPSMEGDITRIRQVIMSLITNAAEAVDEKNGVVSLSTGKIYCDEEFLKNTGVALQAGSSTPLLEGTYVFIDVTDSGCGMDKRTIDKIFDPFFTTKFTGRGLGLAAAMGIIRGHKGTITVESKPGIGSTFKILIPASRSETDQKDYSKGIKERSGESVGGGTILLADDEEAFRTVTAQLLERNGFEVITAVDGREAIDRFQESPDDFDCIILDLTMPNVDGHEAFNEIRKIRKDVKVIICSGYSDLDVSTTFADASGISFLQKPFRAAALKAKLKEILS